MKISDEWLKEKKACGEGIKWFKNQDENDGLRIVKQLIIENKLQWANWLIVYIMDYSQYVNYAVFAVESVLDIYEQKYPNDKRPREAIEAAKKCIKIPNEKNKTAAHAAAYAANAATNAATYAADAAAYAAAHAATYAAYAAADAAYAANAATYAADAATNAADAATDAAYAADAATYAADAATDAAYAAYAADAADAMKLKILKYGIELLEKQTNGL